jgi:adenylate kinase
MRLLIMGPPGAGKGTQAVTLARSVRGAHISTGEIFRAHVRQGTALGMTARRSIDAGAYVPDEVTNAMVRERLAQDDAQQAFVLDGYPRTVDQVRTLDRMLDELSAALDGVIELVVDPAELISRLLKRAETTGRSDDTEEVIHRRLALYTSETDPLLRIYRDRGLLRRVDGLGKVDEVASRIHDALAVAPPAR